MNRIRIESGVYHCISRANGRLMLLDRPEVKEQFVAMLEKVAGFCSMEVFSFCVMGNHFHVLVREKAVPRDTFDDAVLEAKLLLLYGSGKGRILFGQQQAFRKTGNDARADQIRDGYRRMMGDVSWFMRLLKQRFSVWYNQSYGREGTLWSERFRSVAVEDSPDAIRTMAAYIDLNPVRAGLVKDPRDYRWSTIGAAAGGEKFACRAIGEVCAVAWGVEFAEMAWEEADGWWRGQLAEAAGEAKDQEGRVIRRGMSEEMRAKLAGGPTGGAMLLRRVNHLVRGAVIGSRAFVRKVVERERGRSLPINRKSEGVRIPGGPKDGLYSLRAVRRS